MWTIQNFNNPTKLCIINVGRSLIGIWDDILLTVIPNETEIKIGEMLLFNLQMLQFNAHEIYEKIHSNAHRFKGAKINYIGVGLYTTVALFNHQCYPAVTRWVNLSQLNTVMKLPFSRYFIGKNIVINSIRPLKNGDIVAENYGPIFTKKNLVARKNFLNSRYWFDCQCSACVQNWPSFDLNKEDASVRLRRVKFLLIIDIQPFFLIQTVFY